MLAEHFRDSYLKHAKPEIVRTREKSEEGLAAILERHAEDAAKIPVPEGAFPPQTGSGSTATTSGTWTPGASGPSGPSGPTGPSGPNSPQ